MCVKQVMFMSYAKGLAHLLSFQGEQSFLFLGKIRQMANVFTK
jgi:hypothetical protein